MTEASKTCPRCGVVSVASAGVCECGYNLASGQMTAQPTTRRRSPWWRRTAIGCGVLILAYGVLSTYTCYVISAVPARTFLKMHAAVRPGMTRLEVLQTLADVRGAARLQVTLSNESGPIIEGDQGEILAWMMGHQPTRAELETLDRKLAAGKELRVVGHAGFTATGFTINMSADGRVEKIGNPWKERD
jgi:hypothetical protein